MYAPIKFQYSTILALLQKQVKTKTFKAIILDKRLDSFTKLSKIGSPMEYVSADFMRFSGTNVKICIWVADWVITIKS